MCYEALNTHLRCRGDVRYSFTEKWENCTTSESPSWTTVIRLEHVKSIASSWSSHHQSTFNFGISPQVNALKSSASTSASSVIQSGLTVTARHCSRQYACSPLALLMPLNICSYISSRPSSNSSRNY